jgi:curved DNA-binding protein CbpA
VVAPPPAAAPPRAAAPPFPTVVPQVNPATGAPVFPGGAPPVVSATPRPARPGTGSFPAAPMAKPATGTLPAAELTLPQLQQLFTKMKEQTFFEVLGVPKDADVNAVKVAYLKAARSYHPDTVPPNAPPELAKVKADIFGLIGEANRTLSDPKLREDYVAELAAGGTGQKVDVEKLFRAEERFQKGQILVKARKYPEAVKMLDEAITDNAEEPEFYAWRGYARFLGASDQKQVLPSVMKDLQHCTSKNPNVAAAWYFLGFVAKVTGDLKTAKQHFQKTVQLDPKHIDAARELRTMK